MHHGFGVGVAGFSLFGDIVEEVEHQQSLLQPLGGDGSDFGVVEQLDERMDVVAADHGAQQLGGFGLRDERGLDFAMRDSGEERGLDLGGVVDARWHAVS